MAETITSPDGRFEIQHESEFVQLNYFDSETRNSWRVKRVDSGEQVAYFTGDEWDGRSGAHSPATQVRGGVLDVQFAPEGGALLVRYASGETERVALPVPAAP